MGDVVTSIVGEVRCGGTVVSKGATFQGHSGVPLVIEVAETWGTEEDWEFEGFLYYGGITTGPDEGRSGYEYYGKDTSRVWIPGDMMRRYETDEYPFAVFSVLGHSRNTKTGQLRQDVGVLFGFVLRPPIGGSSPACGYELVQVGGNKCLEICR